MAGDPPVPLPRTFMTKPNREYNPEPRSERLRRRLVSVPRDVLILIALTVLFPLLLVGSAIVDTGRWLVRRTPFVATRLLIVAWMFFFAETVGLLRLLGTWITSGFGANRQRLIREAWPVQAWWGRTLFASIRTVFGLNIDVEGEENLRPGPVLAMFRHASIVDNLLPVVYVTDRNGINLRWIIKKELLTLPSLDIGGNRLPNYFVDRNAKDSRTEIRRIRELSQDLGEDEGVLIYPEGTRYTPEKQTRALARLAEGNASIYERARTLRNVMPPRIGGPMILLDAGTDVVFCAHEGLGGFAHIRDIWSGGLVGRHISVKFWRVPASEIPKERSARIDWLFDQWQALDDWVGVKTQERSEGPPVGS
jgi:1-acyl-sn-glycerol-3-phosphate acyltransferase